MQYAHVPSRLLARILAAGIKVDRESASNHPGTKKPQGIPTVEDDNEWIHLSKKDREVQPQSENIDICRPRIAEEINNHGTSGTSPNTECGTRTETIFAIFFGKQSENDPSFQKPSVGSPTPETYDTVYTILLGSLAEGAKFIGHYALSILRTVSYMSRWPIALYMTSLILIFTMGYISRSLRHTLEPLCLLPGISSLSICNPGPRMLLLPNTGSTLTPPWADYCRSIHVEDVQSQTYEGSALSLEIKMAEMAMTDLIAHIRITDLKMKDTLALSLLEFIADAKRVGKHLQKLTSKIGGAVDYIMAVSEHGLQSIARARLSKPSPWSGPFSASQTSYTKQINKVVMQTYDEVMNVLSINMNRLIVEAEHDQHILDNLEARLTILHEVISQEDWFILSAKSDLLGDVWTKLGGNRKLLKKFETHLVLLERLGEYRKRALFHVVAVLQTLRAMNDDMEDMREHAATQTLISPMIPVEVHMKSIQMGLKRLQEGRNQAMNMKEIMQPVAKAAN